jgi:hypothetical protein
VKNDAPQKVKMFLPFFGNKKNILPLIFYKQSHDVVNIFLQNFAGFATL